MTATGTVRVIQNYQTADKFAYNSIPKLPNLLLFPANENSFVSIETKQLDFT
jgi:hypothetical protein